MKIKQQTQIPIQTQHKIKSFYLFEITDVNNQQLFEHSIRANLERRVHQNVSYILRNTLFYLRNNKIGRKNAIFKLAARISLLEERLLTIS